MKAELVFLAVCSAVIMVFVYTVTGSAGELKPIKLAAPQIGGGKPIMQVLNERKSTREFSSTQLPLQVLSDLLWAACGINRPASGGRTAPSARNMQEIDIYVAMSDGLYLYDAKANTLMPVLAGDIRGVTGNQPFVALAPVNLVFVADLEKMGGMATDAIDFYSAADTGFISENVYLFCASAGLATVVRGLIDKAALAKAMKLRDGQRIILAQTVGYPKEYITSRQGGELSMKTEAMRSFGGYHG